MDNKDPNPKRTHRLEDHLYGRDHGHSHEGEETFDHDHDHFEADGRLEDNPLWIQDHVSLLSVGIDIGSSGTQVIFSRLNLRRMGEELSSRYFVVSRETLFQSPVSLTPYRSEELIDDAELGGEFVCASAGHHMESMLAAFGSGAARVSHDSGKRILNIDIGGGTTKLALVER